MNNRTLIQTILAGVLMLALLLGPAAAEQHYWVDAVAGHNGVLHSGSETDPWHTITHALGRTSGSALNPLILHLKAGSYDTEMGADHETFPLNLGDYVSLVGAGRVVTVIDAELGNSNASVITIISRNYVSVQDVTVKQGAPTGLAFGAGLRCESSNYVTIDDCLVTLNDGQHGGGIYLYDCGNTTVKSCLVTDNSVSSFDAFGAGIYMENCGSDVVIEDCVITGNSMEAASQSTGGAGIGCYNSSPVLRLCQILNNTASGRFGGGLCLQHGSYVVIDNCTIAGNQAAYGCGFACRDCAGSGSQIEVINNTDIYGNLGEGKKGLGAYISDSNIEFQDCRIRDHKDAGDGAGVYIVRVSNNFSVKFERTVITGNEATNGSGTRYGAGIFAQGSSGVTLTIKDCTIEDNESAREGGGLMVNNLSMTIDSSTISGNRSSEGAGGIMYFASSGDPIDQNKGKILNCLITDNVSSGRSGGIECYRNASPIIFNCLIAGNTSGGSGNGGGMYLSVSASPKLVNCTIADNVGEGVMARANDDCTPTLTNCILWNNDDDLVNIDCSQLSHCDLQDADCNGDPDVNLNEDPEFVPRDPEDEDVYTGYYLAQVDTQAADSPCLNAGDDQASVYGLDAYTTCTDGRYDEGTVDIGYHYSGAYEGSDDTYIELASFEAKASGRSILITWETGTEIDNAGFDVYRVETGDRTTPGRMNERMIPAQGSAAAGASYEFIDAEVSPGITYSYYLIDIDTSGKTTVHGPVSARVSLSNLAPKPPDARHTIESRPSPWGRLSSLLWGIHVAS
ncbi:MAG: right-handed parallel beta-helix repeat-containing protein [Candidatus Coatesbacteria bacterium]|nr:right-handed parallel beta-helix repeat-containing protein [Candidatus Coatesbacteria bacterium]